MNTERLKTGIRGLDEIISGGIPRGFTVAAVGEPGTGKTVFCIHFIASGLASNEKGIYVTTEESRESIVKQSLLFGFDFNKAVEKGDLIIIDALMSEKDDPWSLRDLDVEELISKIIEARRVLGKGHVRLVVDSMSAFWLDKPAMARKYSYMVKRIISKWDMTIVLTSQYAVTTSLGFGFGIEHVADAVLRFRKIVVGGVLKRFLIIEKMRQTDHDKRVFEIDIVNGKGMVIIGPHKLSREDFALPLSVLAKILEADYRKTRELIDEDYS